MPSYPTQNTQSVTLGDLDGDGKLDLVTAGGSGISVFKGQGDGTFVALAPVAAGSSPEVTALGDFNHDGKIDIATLNALLLGNGDGTFQAPLPYNTNPAGPRTDMTAGDFNRDGHLDLVFTHTSGSGGDSTKVSFVAGRGDGTFLPRQAIPAGSAFDPRGLLSFDMNGDGRMDFIAANGGRIGVTGGGYFQAVSVFYSNGDGTFFRQSASLAQVAVDHGAAGDINGDGRPDLVVSGRDQTSGDLGRKVYVFLQNADSSYASATTLNIPLDDLKLADLNRDGLLDLVGGEGNSVTVRLGHGDGTFGLPTMVADKPGQALAIGDVNGDGTLDVVFAESTDHIVGVALNSPGFAAPDLAIGSFGAGPGGGGWTSDDLYPRRYGDVDGDGRADLVAFGEYGVTVARGRADGTFAPGTGEIRAFGHDPNSGGLTSADLYPREIADVNGDGKADIVAFGDHGTYVALATGGGHFADPILGVAQFGAAADAGGWTSNNSYTRTVADVNGDGMADIVGFGEHGVYVSLATGGGHFGSVDFALAQFGFGADAGGWTDSNLYPRAVGDVNGDGMADLIGFGVHGVYVALATGGGHFGGVDLALNQLGAGADAGGWSSQNVYPREIADVNGDGRADIIGFGENGVFLSLGQADGTFAAATMERAIFSHAPNAGGLTNDDLYPRAVADVNGDGLADLIAAGDNGVYVALSGADFMF